MQKITNSTAPGNIVLPLPPLDYDVAYMTNLIRLLNYYFQQLNNPGLLNGTAIRLNDGDGDDIDFQFDTQGSNDYNVWIINELPTSATGLQSGQIWLNGNVLTRVP
jgi:hypothetical protein